MLKTKSKRCNPGEVLVINSKMKAYISSKGMNSSGDLAEAASDELRKMIDRAIERCKEHGKKTVGPRDL